MKAFAHGFHSTSRHPAIQNCQSSFISPLPSISRGFGAQTGKGVSFRTRDPVALQLACSGKSMESRTSMHVVANIASDGLVSKPSVRRKKLAVFVSGRGSNFQSLYEACIAGSVYGDVVVLVTNKSVCGGAAYAREKDIPVLIFPKTKEEPNGLSAINLVDALRKYDVDFILLAGYLKLIPVELVQAYPKSILNIHPSLLPAFGGKGFFGMKVHRAVIATGARYSGPTIHFVDEHYDTGRILAQRVVPVLATDTVEDLAARVLQEEHGLYVETVAALCEERIVWREDGVPVIQSSENPNMYY